MVQGSEIIKKCCNEWHLKCHFFKIPFVFLPGPPGIGLPGPQGPQGRCEPDDCTHALPHTSQDV